jgi:hypothetical protein
MWSADTSRSRMKPRNMLVYYELDLAKLSSFAMVRDMPRAEFSRE